MGSSNIRDILTCFSPALDYLAISTGDGRIKVSECFDYMCVFYLNFRFPFYIYLLLCDSFCFEQWLVLFLLCRYGTH